MISQASKEVLKNCHTALKWIWIVVMGLAIKKAIEIFIYYTDPVTGAEILKDLQHIYLKDVMLFIIFITTIVRYYHGDCRYLDRTYLESQLRAFDPETYAPKNRFFDFYFLLIHALIFYVLAASQNNFPFFFFTYCLLLLSNTIWLGIVCLRAPRKKHAKYPRKWALNNVIHLVLFIVLYLLSNKLEAGNSYLVFFILALSNTFFDYLTTWNYYFPKIKEEPQELQIA